MSKQICSVKSIHQWLRDNLQFAALTHPRCRQKVSEIFDLIHDMAQGYAGEEKKHKYKIEEIYENEILQWE